MTRKAEFERIYEPDEDMTHYKPPLGWRSVTLCGATDWIGQTHGVDTDAPVDCNHCTAIVEYCQSHRVPNVK
jgi:hypothetical protein